MPSADRTGEVVYVHEPDEQVAVPVWLAVPVIDTLIVAESPARVPHEPPIEVTLTLVVNGNVAAAPLTWVMVTTGAVVSVCAVTTTFGVFGVVAVHALQGVAVNTYVVVDAGDGAVAPLYVIVKA